MTGPKVNSEFVSQDFEFNVPRGDLGTQICRSFKVRNLIMYGSKVQVVFSLWS